MPVRNCTSKGWENSGGAWFSGVLLAWSLFAEIFSAYRVMRDFGFGGETARNAYSVVLVALHSVFTALALSNLVRCAMTDNSPDANPWDGAEEAGVKKCPKCGSFKPERCHHCRWCGCCVLKYDHHCPWVGNCVGFFNYKYFMNFMVFTMLACVTAVLSSVPCVPCIFVGDDFNGHALHGVLNGFVGVLVLVMAGNLCTMHACLICHNETTTENDSVNYCVRTSGNVYDLGNMENFRQVYGGWSKILLWGLPVFTSEGNGWTFPRAAEKERLTDSV